MSCIGAFSGNLHSHRYSDGFTLLEVLVALTLCGVITVLAYQSLQTASDSAARSEQSLTLVQKLDYTWGMLERDLQQAVSIPTPAPEPTDADPTDEGANADVAFWGRQPIAPPIEANRQQVIALSRQGWRNPLQRQRSELQRIHYLLLGDQLQRHAQVMEKISTASEDSIHQDLIDDIDALSIGFLPVNSKSLQTDAWLEQWPPVGSKVVDGLPLAVRIDISHKTLGQVSRVFYLPAASR
ncbi:GspJ family T2SS minor pseudopilin variant XcpW [Maricurvus nonylphenolicus]|uniref:type II secretion system minor pseudopilin GspJ n=1 Tax=Maricurvus nonylphenolicus TaxID=1008307 RepID=UPI0036F4314A